MAKWSANQNQQKLLVENIFASILKSIFYCFFLFLFIDEFGSMGFQVVNGEGKVKGGREAIKQLRNRIPLANRHSSMEIKPSRGKVYIK